jgi:hypothetical protein
MESHGVTTCVGGAGFMKVLVDAFSSVPPCIVPLLLLLTSLGCGSSSASFDVDAGVDAGPKVPMRVEAGRLGRDGGPVAACGSTLDGEGCSCTPGAPARSCYVGAASQAGVGSCVYGHQSCVSEGESGGRWGACTGSGAPTASCTAGSSSHCGGISDGCGGVLKCGTCPEGQSCGGGGEPNVCGVGTCAPSTCSSQGLACGAASDSCGGTLNCGACPGGETCGGAGIPNQCACAPTTCTALGDACGTDTDGCGGTLNCGACPEGQTCGSGGTPHQCGCTATTTCQSLGYACGSTTDNCGNSLDCGSCSSGQVCGGGGTAHQCAGGTSTCPAFQQYCPAFDPGVTQAHPVIQQPTASACQAYCDSFADTLCCSWAPPPGNCVADSSPTCVSSRVCYTSSTGSEWVNSWSSLCE